VHGGGCSHRFIGTLLGRMDFKPISSESLHHQVSSKQHASPRSSGSSEQGARCVRSKGRKTSKGAAPCSYMVDRNSSHSVRFRYDRVSDGRLGISVFATGEFTAAPDFKDIRKRQNNHIGIRIT